MRKSDKKMRMFGKILFILYLVVTLYAMFFSESLDRTMVSDEYRYNLVLFKEINRFWRMKHTYGWQITIMNLAGNVAFFMPFGFLLPSMSREKIVNNFVSVTLLTMVFSMLIETAQLVLKVGAFDVDDIFLNTVGGLLGYIVLKIMKLFKQRRKKRRKRREKRTKDTFKELYKRWQKVISYCRRKYIVIYTGSGYFNT